MKINEKHLISFAGSNSPTSKKGYLYKRGEVNKAFQKRWFILKGNLLFYFEKKDDREAVGVIILEGCTVELSEMNDTNTFTFELVFQGSGSRTYILAAETQEEMEAWMKAITCANYDYMKLMVSELQLQLDELNKESAEQAASNIPSQLVDLSVASNSEAGISFTPACSKPYGFINSSGNTLGSLNSHGQCRTFEQMHADFGKAIKGKSFDINSASGGAPLIQLSHPNI